MRFYNTPTKKWSPWFAWFPVRLRGTDTEVWLEWVERKPHYANPPRCYRYRETE